MTWLPSKITLILESQSPSLASFLTRPKNVPLVLS